VKPPIIIALSLGLAFASAAQALTDQSRHLQPSALTCPRKYLPFEFGVLS
jgi:hypothetical protein